MAVYVLVICVFGEFATDLFKVNLNYRIASYGHMYTRLKEVKNQKKVDVLILGSSHAYRGFDTRIFNSYGFKTFNLGSSSQTPIQSYYLLRKYYTKLKPRIVILEVNWDNFVSDGVESTLDVIANDKNDLSTLDMVLSQNHIKIYNTLIYGFYRDLFNRNSSVYQPKNTSEDIYVFGGYVEKRNPIFCHTQREHITNQTNEKQEKVFFELVSFCTTQKIRLILVQSPVTKAYYQNNPNNLIFDKKMKVYSEYYNFNDTAELDNYTFFYDDEHLNQTGVELFNKKVLKILLP
jgi:hypothetical protein